MADIAKITALDGVTYDLKDKIARTAIGYGQVDSTSTATVFTAQIEGVESYYDGLAIMLRNGVVTSASGCTLNINSLGAKPIYNSMKDATRETTIFNIDYTMMFVYDSTRVSGGCWICYRGYDSNTNTIGYQIRTNSSTRPVTDQTGRYRILFSNADNTAWVPSNTSSSTNATASRDVNQRPINPFGRIIYYAYTTVLSAGTNISTAYQYDQYTVTFGYSFNRTNAGLVLTYPAPIYIKCAPQSDGTAIIDSTTPYVQELPSTNDGKIYIYLGQAYSATAVEMTYDHPIFYHDGTRIRLWTDAASGGGVTSVNGETGDVVLDIPTKTSDLTNDSGFITDAGVTSFNGATGAVTYTAPVTSVNGNTGAVTVSVPTKTSDLTNDSGFITDAGVTSVNGETGAVVLDASDVGALPDSTTIPTKTSDLTNDSGFLTSYTETDPTVPAWAKASSKPTYTASEVGALPDSTAIPTKTSDLTNDAGFITANDVPQEVFIVTVEGHNSNEYVYTKDKTFAEITAAILANKACLLVLKDYNAGSTVQRTEVFSASHISSLTGSATQVWFTKVYTNGDRSINTTKFTIKSDETVTSTSGSLLIMDTYSASSQYAMSGVAVASAISGKQDTANLVTSLSSSSTDTTYPSAKAVYDAIPSATSDLTNDSGFITSSDIPVTSVNSKTGAVSLSASDVGALPDSTTIPSKTSDLTNDSGFITDAGVTSFNGSTGAITYTAPVTSVNSKTGAVSLTASDVGAISGITVSLVDYDSGYILTTNGAGNKTSFSLPRTLSIGTEDSVGTQYLEIGRSHSEDGFKGRLKLSNSGSGSKGFTSITPSANADIGLTLPSSTGTLALTSQIPTVPTTVSSFTNDAGYITTETDPVFTASAAHGITSNDISAWNAKTDTIVVTVATVSNPVSGTPSATTADKTYAEVTAALEAKKTVVVLYDGKYYPYSLYLPSSGVLQNVYVFGESVNVGGSVSTRGLLCSNNYGWFYYETADLIPTFTYTGNYDYDTGVQIATLNSTNNLSATFFTPKCSLSISGNRITLTQGTNSSYVDLPIYDGSVT